MRIINNSQVHNLPLELSLRGPIIGDLISAIASDTSYSANERIQCLSILLDRVCSERPKLINSIFLARMCHQVAKLQKKINLQTHYSNESAPSTPLMEKLSLLVMQKVEQFNSHEISNTAWAIATLKYYDNNLIKALSTRTQQAVELFTSQGVANTAWAFATLGYCDKNLMKTLSARAQQIVGSFNSQDVANTAWALATLDYYDYNLMNALNSRALNILDQFNSQGVINTAWALATLRHYDKHLMNMLSTRVQQIVGGFSSQDIANTAWAFAKLGYCDKHLTKALTNRAGQIIDSFNTQDLTNTAWAFGILDPDLIHCVANANLLNDDRLADIEFLQLFQALLVNGELSPEIKNTRYETIKTRYKPEAPSNFETEVAEMTKEVLRGKNFKIDFGNVLFGVGVDWILEINNSKIVIECDGTQFHKTRGPDGGTQIGKDIIQDRIFKILGYKIIHVDSQEWAKAKCKLEFMRDLLKQALNKD